MAHRGYASLILATALAALATPVLAQEVEPATSFGTLYRFKGYSNDGNLSRGTLVFGSDGALYGTTYYGGTYCAGGCGTIFQLKQKGSSWAYSRLRLGDLGFAKGGPNEGFNPIAGLTLHSGALYGVNSTGGNTAKLVFGTVFKVTPPHGSVTSWALHAFYKFEKIGTAGYSPVGGIIFGPDGAIYGTTSKGGTHGNGTVFRLTLGGTRTTLYNFTGATGDSPQGDLIFGKDGALYGTTYGGGKYKNGVVFRLAHSGSHWTPTVLYNFNGGNVFGKPNDGSGPLGRIVLGSDGSVYGTTQLGGKFDHGTIYKLQHQTGAGAWKHSFVHEFGSVANDGRTVDAGLTIDSSHHLYGTTSDGGTQGNGILFKVSLTGAGYTILRQFHGLDANGGVPLAGVILKGTAIYGTTTKGGAFNATYCQSTGCGTVFKLQQ